MTSINPTYNINYAHSPVFKAKEENISAPVSNPVPAPNFAFKGTEALRAYNYNLINKNNDFNVTLVKPVKVPDDINEVKGERIYNSAGELMEIIYEDKDFKYIYKPGDIPEEKYIVTIFDKKTNKLIKSQTEFKYTMYENPLIDVTEFNDGTQIRTAYDSKTLVPTHFDKTINNAEKEKHISYGFEDKEFFKYEYDKINNIEQRTRHDKKGNLIGKPDITNNTEEYADLEKPELHPEIKLDYDPKQLDGEKKYYSNGIIEQNIVNENGKMVVYNFDTNGKIEEIQKDNLTIHYFTDENNRSGYSISETLGNGKSKTTTYMGDGTKSYSLGDNGSCEQYVFNKKGDIIDFFDYTYEEI